MEDKSLPVANEISIADDFLIQVAEHAERRVNAVIKIKQVALKVTNPRDWTDQNGNPYLQVSGSEKIANLFNISWRIDEPLYNEEADGHFTWTYKGEFSLGGRTIEAVGTRSSKDTFFNKYEYSEPDDKGKKTKTLLGPGAIDKGDVKKAAFTNLLGNGITRILGIRNLTWEDLKAFANITREQVTSIQYKKGGEPIKEPQKKGTMGHENAVITVKDLRKQDKKKDGAPMKSPLYIILDDAGVEYKTFSETLMKIAHKEKGTGMQLLVEFKKDQFGNMIIDDGLSYADQPPEDANAQ